MILCALLLTCLLLVSGQGSPLLKHLDERIGVNDISLLQDASSYTKLYLYTKETGDSSGESYVEIIYGNLSSLSNLDVSKPTKVLIHGWLDTAFNNAESALRTAYLSATDLDVNVLSVDWSKKGDNWLYPIARYAVVPVGKYLAEVVDWMVTDAGVSVDSIHVIGHSLGAQIGGVIGEHVTVGQIGRVSGLDPAGPGFSSSKSGRLDSSDAQFVDVIHTCGGLYGYYDPCGHVDFYPNKGTYNQPGCATLDIGKCSHIRSYFLYAESISSEAFVATPCSKWQDFAKGVCDGNSTTVMGEYVDTSARGNYYLYTAGSSPYALDGHTTASSEHTDKYLLRNKQLIKNCLIFLFLKKLFANI